MCLDFHSFKQEGWPALDCIYFSVITFTSAGLGDYVPTTDGAKIICSIFIYFGVACIGLLLGSLLAGSLDDKSRIIAKENLVKNCPNCNRTNSFARPQTFFNNKAPPINKPAMSRPQNAWSSERNIPTNLRTTPRASNNTSTTRQPFARNDEKNDRADDYSVTQQQMKLNNNGQINNHLAEHHPLIEKDVPTYATDFSSVTPQPPESNFFLSPTTSSAGSHDPVAVINRQSHTRHLSLSADFGKKNMFENAVRRNNEFSLRIPNSVVPSIYEYEQFQYEQQARLAWENDNFDDEYDDGFDSDSLSSGFDSDINPNKNNDLKTAKYVFQTLHQALANSTFIIAIGSIGFYIIEGMSAVDAFYFTTVLLTTVGYGDIVPHTNEGKLFATVYVLVAGTILLHNMSLISMIPLEMRKRRIERIVLRQFGESVDDATLLELASGPLVQRLHMSANSGDGLHHCTREMFALAMLVRLGRVTERDVRSTFAAFNRLDLDKDGKLDSKEIILSTVARMQSKHTAAMDQNEQENIDEFSECLDDNEVHSNYNESMAYSENQSSYDSPSKRIFPKHEVTSQMDGIGHRSATLSPRRQPMRNEYSVSHDSSDLEVGQYANDYYGSLW